MTGGAGGKGGGIEFECKQLEGLQQNFSAQLQKGGGGKVSVHRHLEAIL